MFECLNVRKDALCLMSIVALCAFTGRAVDDTVVAWTNGMTLVVEGKGKMKDFTAESPVPWAKGDIVLATVGSDVTSLGKAAFADSRTGAGSI